MNLSCSQTANAGTDAAREGLMTDLWRQMPVGLGVFDAKLHLDCCNAAFEQLCGGGADTLRGTYLLKLLPLEEERLPSIMAALKLRGRWRGIAHDDRLALRIEMARHTHPDGTVSYPFSVIDYAEDFRQLRDLSAARELAEKTDKAKSRFLSHMSHELRTPLNAILGFTQLMQVSEDLTPVQHDNLREIESAGSYLLGLINEILDLSRIEAGNLRLNEESLLLEKLVRECLALTRTLADRKQVSVSYACNVSRPLTGDHARLKQVLMNILSNAVKFNRNGGKVSVHCNDDAGGRLHIEVRDNGPGIRHDVQASIFSPFARLAADAQGNEGSGIGLMITRRLVQLMGGRIGLCSEPGRGSVFWLELPVPDQANQEPAAAASCLLYSIGNESAWNSLLQRLLALRPGVRLRCFDTLLDAMPTLEDEHPDCLLLRASAGLPAVDLGSMTQTLKKPLLVAVDHDLTQSATTQAPAHWHSMLPAEHSLHDLLTLIDSLHVAEKEQP